MKPKPHRNSFLQTSNFIEHEGYGYWESGRLKTFIEDPTDTRYTVTDGDKIDNLAYTFYGDPRLMWIICWANGFGLPEIEMYEGRTILIPSKKRILTEVIKG